MDKNQAIGLLLISLLLIVYIYYFAPQAPAPQQEPQGQEQVDPATKDQGQNQEQLSAEEPLSDSLQQLQNQEKYGSLASAATGEARSIQFENDDMIIRFNTKGGMLEYVELKDYKTYYQEPLVLLDNESNTQEMLVNTERGVVDLYDFYYQASSTGATVSGEDTLSISFRIPLGDGYIQQIYTIPGTGYELGYTLSLEGTESIIQDQQLSFNWANRVQPTERDLQESRLRSNINYYTASGSVDDLGAVSGSDTEEEQLDQPIRWIAMQQRFFTSAIIAHTAFTNGVIRAEANEYDTSIVNQSSLGVNMALPEGGAGSVGWNYYFGPNRYEIMKDVAPEFGENVDFGWWVIGWINKHIVRNMFRFLEQFISNYGVIIILLVLIIRVVLSPLSYKSYISMAKTKVLKPEMDELKAKYGEDMQKMQSEQMKLYQQVGVNPLSGCIPLLLQMPFLLAMFYFFPNAIELRQESFLWADDLSTYDAIITWDAHIPLLSDFYGNHVSLFTLLMTLSTILYTWSNSQLATIQGPMKMMQYFFPVIFMFVLNSFPAALSFYYFVSNIVSFAQQALIRRFVDEGKIRKTLDENKKRNVNKKKSKFQLRLEEAMKTTDETQKKKRKMKPERRSGERN